MSGKCCPGSQWQFSLSGRLGEVRCVEGQFVAGPLFLECLPEEGFRFSDFFLFLSDSPLSNLVDIVDESVVCFRKDLHSLVQGGGQFWVLCARRS